MFAGLGVVAPRPTASQAVSNAFYVNCNSGNDAAAGTIDQPWRTLGKASKAPLLPGGSLFLARGCSWSNQQLAASWNGRADAAITITGYGDGPRPMIRNSPSANIKVTGSYLVIDGLESGNDPRQVVGCGQPIGQYYGFTFVDGAHDNTLTNSVSSGSTAGVHLASSSRANRIIANVLTGNNVLQTFGTSDDIGAWGINVHSNDNEIAYNQISSNAGTCANGSVPRESNSVELYEASGNSIHDNVSFDDRVFSELGSSAAVKSANNVFANNLFVTDRPMSRFVTTRGAGDTAFGPVPGTQLLNNTTYQTGPGSQSVVCILGCGGSVLRAANNIFWAEQKAMYADALFDLGPNWVWNSTGDPLVQVPNAVGITAADPGFVDPASNNFTARNAPGFGAAAASALAGPAPSPLRILDTRPAPQRRGYTGSKPGPGDVVSVQVAGRAGVPDTGVAAVMIDVIMTESAGDGFVTVWPSGKPRPLASSLNVEGVGSTISNLVTVPLGPDGKIQIFTQSGGHLVVDVAGWLPTGSFVGTNPTRVLDTRPAPQQLGYAGDKPGRGAVVEFDPGPGVPSQGVSAVVLNITATEANDAGFITVWPSGTARPLASALNTVWGGTNSNQVTVAPGANGKISIFTQYGAHLVVDVSGYYKAGQSFVPSTPTRLLDTRPGVSQLEYAGTKPAAGQIIALPVLGNGPVPKSGVKAVVLNLTATEAASPGFVSAWPGGEPRPLTSVLNLTAAGQTRSNAVFVPVGADGTVQLFSQSGTHLVVDVTGWITG